MTAALWVPLVALAAALLGWVVSHVRAGRTLSREIARRQALEEAMQRLKDGFAGKVSHQLRTPLTAIGGFIELVADGEAGPVNETQREFLQIAARNTEHLGALIDDLLDTETIEIPMSDKEIG